ncbi:MAG: hypothetical protein ACR2GC_01075 [Methyloceanibacter sp.]|uniref:hypothetical protein n=1 Tax=Methyloceanibacter sp. TaxID=1965321 RepID=UPI003D9BFCC0
MERRRLYNKQLSEADEDELGRLAKKYGRKFIADEVMKVPLSSMGRPPTETPAHNAVAIECAIDERRVRGSRSPVDDVARVIYRQEHGGRKGDAGWETFLKNFKRNRPRGRQKVMAWAKSHQADDEWRCFLDEDEA